METSTPDIAHRVMGIIGMSERRQGQTDRNPRVDVMQRERHEVWGDPEQDWDENRSITDQEDIEKRGSRDAAALTRASG